MLSIFDTTSARQVLDQPLNPALRKIIPDRLADANAISSVCAEDCSTCA